MNARMHPADMAAAGQPKEPGHTPGPWAVSQNFNGIFGRWMNPGLEPIGFVYHPALPDKSEVGARAMADARLIAAAPDLYDACDNALNTLIGCCIGAGGVDDRKTIIATQAMLRDALRKAAGGAS